MDVYTQASNSALAIGDIFCKAQVTLDKKFSEWVNEDCTLNLVKGKTNYEWLTVDEYKGLSFYNESLIKPTENTTTIVKISVENVEDYETFYCMFCDKAYATVKYTRCNKDKSDDCAFIKYGESDYYLNQVTKDTADNSAEWDSLEEITKITTNREWANVFDSERVRVDVPNMFITE